MPIERATRADDRCILLFVKYPHDGLVKQRLAVDLCGIRVSELYRNFVLDLLATLGECRVAVQICYYPEERAQECVEWLGKRYGYLPQTGADLGERMRNAFTQTFLQGYRRVVLLGSDVPDLPARIIRRALLLLTKRDAVIGPCPDGGYYLIGFRNQTFVPDAFCGLEWSTTAVFRKTMKCLMNEGRSVSMLPEWGDIDTLEDLHDLVKRAKTSPFRGSRTMSFLRSCNFPLCEG